MARTSKETETPEVETPEKPATVDYMKEKVKIRLFKDNDKYKDDLFVAVNGRTFQIKRGVEVEVPKAVEEVIRRSEEADLMTATLIAATESEYESKNDSMK